MTDHTELLAQLKTTYNGREALANDADEGPWVPASAAYEAADVLRELSSELEAVTKQGDAAHAACEKYAGELAEAKAWGDRMEAARNRDFDQAMQNGAAANALRSQLQRARKWLQHEQDCESGINCGPNECPCGFNAFLAELPAAQPPHSVTDSIDSPQAPLE